MIAGRFAHAPTPERITVFEGLVAVDDTGVIAEVVAAGEAGYAGRRDRAVADGRLVETDARAFVIPGLVDCHVHAPQYPQLGQALDEPLEVWLQRYTFPLEARYADLEFAREVYSALVADLLAGGTTTALYFATIDVASTKLLADLCIEIGQRAVLGKVTMDDPAACPDYYRDASAEAAIAGTRAVIEHVRAHPGNGEGRVLPAVIPRFIPSCTDEALAGLGALAAECGCHVHTHASESDWAHNHALERYGETDTAALDRFGLLGRQTVLAHSNFITDDDMQRLRQHGAGVAHCALSNAYFANAVFPLRRALDKGVHVGLGTDISGGPSGSMLEAMRMTVTASRMLETGVDPALRQAERGRAGSRVDLATAFHLATAGGGVALDLPIGQFAPGYQFDALVIDPDAPLGSIRLFEDRSEADAIAAVLYQASRANIAQVYVGGRRVAGAAEA